MSDEYETHETSDWDADYIEAWEEWYIKRRLAEWIEDNINPSDRVEFMPDGFTIHRNEWN